MDGWTYLEGSNRQIMFRVYVDSARQFYELRCHEISTNRRWEVEVYDDHITFPSLSNCAASTAMLMVKALEAGVQFMRQLQAI